ncbi:MAG: hypothetical protein ACI35S_06770 [Anaeroplasma sp.]
MEDSFDIIKYICGLTDYNISESVATTIAIKRNVIGLTSITELTPKDNDLLLADVLFSLLLKPKKTASITVSHGDFSKSIGSEEMQSLGNLINYAKMLYAKWGEELPEIAGMETGTLMWLDM